MLELDIDSLKMLYFCSHQCPSLELEKYLSEGMVEKAFASIDWLEKLKGEQRHLHHRVLTDNLQNYILPRWQLEEDYPHEAFDAASMAGTPNNVFSKSFLLIVVSAVLYLALTIAIDFSRRWLPRMITPRFGLLLLWENLSTGTPSLPVKPPRIFKHTTGQYIAYPKHARSSCID